MNQNTIIETIRLLPFNDRTKILAEIISTEPTQKEIIEHLKGILQSLKSNKPVLYALQSKAFNLYASGGNEESNTFSARQWMEKKLEKDMNWTPIELTKEYMSLHKVPPQAKINYYNIAVSVKNLLYKRQNYAETHPNVKKYKRKKDSPSNSETPSGGNIGMARTPQGGSRMHKQKITTADVPVVVASKVEVTQIYDLLGLYRTTIDAIGAGQLIEALHNTYAQYMDIPSIVVSHGERYETELRPLKGNKKAYNALKNTSLYDHTIHVLQNAIQLSKLRHLPESHQTFAPFLIITALAHDIGKIPQVRKDTKLRTSSHEIISVRALKHLRQKVCPNNKKLEYWVNEAVKMIKNHHGSHKNDALIKLFMEADARARIAEIKQQEPSMMEKDLTKWLNIDELGEVILTKVNVLTNNKWQAIVYNKIVYCMHGFILDALAILAARNNIIDYRLLRQGPEDKEAILIEAVDIFGNKNKDVLAWDIPKGRYFNYFVIELSEANISNKKLKLIAFKTNIFKTDLGKTNINSRRTGYLRLITNITHTDGE